MTKTPALSSQRLAREFHLEVDGTSTAAIDFGAEHATLTDNGTGDYTLTFAEAFADEWVHVSVSAIATGGGLFATVHSRSATACRILIESDAGAATDAVFSVLIRGYDTAENA